MNKKSRFENSIQNSIFGVATQISHVLLSFLVRTFFIAKLGVAYLGVNGLYTNILTMLSIAELGVGSTIVYNMYKPIADNDEIQIAKLMNLYKKAYSIIGIIVALLGVCLIPFMDFIITDKPNVSNLTVIYLLFLSNTVFSYFFAYKRSIFNADQRERIIKAFNLGTTIIRSVLQIASLVVLNNYIVYLVIQIVCTCVENVCISMYADKSYPLLKRYRNEQLSNEQKKPIFDNIKATFIYKIGSAALNGTDNIIISAVNGVISVGLLSNYTLITSSVEKFLSIITSSMTGSIGNYIAKEKEEKHEGLLNKLTFVNFVMYGLLFVGSIAVINPFISMWIGDDYLLSFSIVFVHCLNIYIYGMVCSVWTFRATMGLFVYGKWRPLVSAIINIIVSIWWGKEFGLIGVLLGTTFTRVATNVWFDPLIVYKHGIHKTPYKYYVRWCIYLLIVLADIGIIRLLQTTVPLVGMLAVLIYGFAAVIVFLISITIAFSKTEEFKYLLHILQRLIKK